MPTTRQLISTILRLHSSVFASLLTPLFAATLVPLLGAGFAAQAAAAELTIAVSEIRAQQGQLMIAVLGSEAAFKGEAPPTLSVMLPPNAERVSFSTDALVPGEYAVRVMHDENGNQDMDNNLVGMPTEPWGFSNNAVGSFGPPGWSDVRFSLDESASIDISLNH